MDFIKNLPKVELHAHLNGSLSNETLLKLLHLKSGSEVRQIEPEFYKIAEGENLTLDECFLKFKYGHDLTNTREAVKLATSCMIADFARENTIYLEIRSTPKANENFSKMEYVEAMIEAIREAPPSITVKLIVSINRDSGLEAARENVQVAIRAHEKHPDVVKGMDLSGNPLALTFEDFRPALEEARGHGLKMAIHCAEVTENFQDVEAILRFGPERVGHGTFIRETDETNWRLLREKRPLVECCLTSNVKCGTVKSLESHHLRKLLEIGHPVAICTDDFGVFDTSLTREVGLAAVFHELSNQQVREVMVASVDHSFASEEEKERLRKAILKY